MRKRSPNLAVYTVILGISTLGTVSVHAQPAPTPPTVAPSAVPDRQIESGRLLLTGGVSNVEGAGGGGLATWALITGYGTRDSIGVNVHGTYVRLTDYDLTTEGFAFGLYNRLEISYAHQDFNTLRIGALLGVGRGFTFSQEILGAKLRVYGDAIYDQDSYFPQIAVGAQYKVSNKNNIVKAVGAKSSAGIDFYVAATKLYLNESLLVDATLRMTRANELGILGFGGPRSNEYRPQFEGSIAYLLTKSIAIGAEYRTKSSNLGFTKESDWKDIFIAWAPTKNVSVTLAYVDLGTIATRKNQRGVYLSAQLGF